MHFKESVESRLKSPLNCIAGLPGTYNLRIEGPDGLDLPMDAHTDTLNVNAPPWRQVRSVNPVEIPIEFERSQLKPALVSLARVATVETSIEFQGGSWNPHWFLSLAWRQLRPPLSFKEAVETRIGFSRSRGDS